MCTPSRARRCNAICTVSLCAEQSQVERDGPVRLYAHKAYPGALLSQNAQGIGPEEESGGGTTFLWRLSVDETAEVLKVSPKTVDRDWKFARLWLLQELNGKRHDGR